MRIAIYLRISSEDGDLKDTGKAESESISNQRGLLLNFISNHSEFSGWEVSEFCDDGWSGKNFERPDFLRMMEQIKQGQIDCVPVSYTHLIFRTVILMYYSRSKTCMEKLFVIALTRH